MAHKKPQSGMTLTELLVVMAVIALLLGVSVPAAKRLMDSYESSTGVRNLINAALANARAIAIRHQTYAGVRFQEDTEGNTYMIFIIHDPDPAPNGTGLANGFRAVEGRKPMKLPENVGLISGSIANESDKNLALWQDYRWRNANTFSVVFSSSGKLVTHPVRVRNKDGATDSSSSDTIFNVMSVVDAGKAMFYQDDYGASDAQDLGLQEEDSVQSLILYDKKEVKTNTDTLWDEYFSKQKIDYISPYSGEIVMKYNDGNP